MMQALVLLLTSLPLMAVGQLQPQVVTMEMTPSIRGCGIISLPEGSPWCQGRPTTWIPGHKDFVVDRPNCLVNGKWEKSTVARMDIIDRLNKVDNPTVQDRHDCGVIDANNDGLLDIYCTVGANRGEGYGFNELYLTRKDGSLFKIRRHALQRFSTVRTRHTAVLRGVNNTELVFISASYGPRQDGRYNKHAMFRKNGKWGKPWRRYFTHLRGPYQTHTNSSCALAVDLNGDGNDELILCNQAFGAYMYLQLPNGRFRRNTWPSNSRTSNWRGATVGDFNGDGIKDIAVTYHDEERSFLNVFRGIPEEPFFDFDLPYYSYPLTYAAPDLEAIDINRDGIDDLYIVQADEGRRPNNYCGGKFVESDWWPINPVSPMTPPPSWIPPPDIAPDLLLISNPNVPHRFEMEEMQHREPGCGYFVKKFGERSLALVQGGFVRPGHQLMLNW